MQRFSFIFTMLVLWSGLGCVENLPDVITLTPGASNVEVISDTPNSDVYVAVGQVSARVGGVEVSTAVREAKNELRNQAAARGATFVSIDEISSRASWDLRGRTVVSMTGTAYKQK
jgi:carbon monoxide dehydrogenase subunit G